MSLNPVHDIIVLFGCYGAYPVHVIVQFSRHHG